MRPNGRDHPPDHPGDDRPGRWLALGDAARTLGLTRSAVYRRVRSGALEARPRGNRGLEVLVGPNNRDHPPDYPGDGARDDRDHPAALLERAARAEGELVAKDALVATLTAALAKAEARGDRLEQALADARRPWLAKVLEGLRRR